MRVELKNIVLNPYRNLKICPLDENKVIRLVASYEENEFWENLIGRVSPFDATTVELAFGAHRLEALKRMNIESIEIKIKDLSDADMIRIMGAENRDWYGNRADTIVETVEVAKKYIEDEILKKECVYEDLEDWCKALFNGESGFHHSILSHLSVNKRQQIKIGRNVLHRFLGNTWSNNAIKTAIDYINGKYYVKEKVIDPKAEEEVIQVVENDLSKNVATKLSKIGHAEAFREVLKEDQNSRIAFSKKSAQDTVIDEILNENKKVTSTVIKDEVRKKAKDRLDNSKEEKISYTQKIKEQTIKNSDSKLNNRSKVLLKELRRIHKSIEDFASPTGKNFSKNSKFIDSTKQNILSKSMVKEALQSLHRMEFLIHVYKEQLAKLSGIEIDRNSVCYAAYDDLLDFKEDDFKYEKDEFDNIWEDDDLIEVPISSFFSDDEDLTNEEDEWLKKWLLNNKSKIQEENG